MANLEVAVVFEDERVGERAGGGVDVLRRRSASASARGTSAMLGSVGADEGQRLRQ